MGPQAAGQQLGGQAVGEGGLAGGGGACNHHETDILPGGDLLCNVADPLFHQRLMGKDQLGGVAGGHNVVHLADVGDVHGGGTPLCVVHSPEHLHGRGERPHLLRVFQRRQPEDEAVLKRFQCKPLEIAGIRHHVAVEIVGKAVQRVEVHAGADAVFQDACLVLHAVGLQEGYGVLDVHGALFDGKRLLCQFSHSLFHFGQQTGIEVKRAPRPAEQGVAEGELCRDIPDVFPAHHVIKRLEHQQNGAALVSLMPRLVRAGDHGEGAVPLKGLVKLPELALPVYQQDLVGIFRLKIGGDGSVGGAVGVLAHRAVDGHVYHLRSFHKGPPSII